VVVVFMPRLLENAATKPVLYGYCFTGFGKNVKHERTNVGAIYFPKKVERKISKPGVV
jgi:hypothetical protein